MKTEWFYWRAGSIPKFSGPKLNGNKSCKNTLMNLEPSRLNMNTGTLGPNSLINCLHMPQGLIGSSESPLMAINLSFLWPSVCQIVSSFHKHYEILLSDSSFIRTTAFVIVALSAQIPAP